MVESAPAPDELKIWVEMMDEDELLLQADDLVEALSFDREAFIPLPVPFFSEFNFEDFITLFGAVDYSRVLKGETILEAGAEEDFWWFRSRDTSIFRSMVLTWRKWVRAWCWEKGRCFIEHRVMPARLRMRIAKFCG